MSPDHTEQPKHASHAQTANSDRHTRRSIVRARGILGAALLALLIAGCGEIKNTITPKPNSANAVTVELTGGPSAYYAGLYMAQALGYFKQTDMNVTFLTPSSGDDPLTMLHDDQVLVAISSEPSVFLQRNEDRPLVSVAALVQRPLSQIPVQVPSKRHPSGGVSLGGSKRAGGHTAKTTTTRAARRAKRSSRAARTTKTTTTPQATTATTATTPTIATTSTTATSTNPTTSTSTATTPATTTTGATQPPTTTTPTPAQVPSASSWPAQLPQLLADAGAPTYNGLVVVVRKGTIVEHAGLVRRFVQAAARGYSALRGDPRAGIADLIAANPQLARQRRQLLATLTATLPYFFPSGDIWGWQDQAAWNTFGTWLARHGLITTPNAIANASTNELLQGAGV